MLSDEAIETRLNELREKAAEYATAYAEKEYLEEFKKTKLALLMKDAEKSGCTSAAAQEREARASKEYSDFLDGLKAATEKAERLRWQLRIAEIGADVWRSQEATKRAERKGYGA